MVGEQPIGGFPQASKIFFEEKRRCNLTSQDLALFDSTQDDITPKNGSELDPSFRTGAISVGL